MGTNFIPQARSLSAQLAITLRVGCSRSRRNRAPRQCLSERERCIAALQRARVHYRRRGDRWISTGGPDREREQGAAGDGDGDKVRAALQACASHSYVLDM